MGKVRIIPYESISCKCGCGQQFIPKRADNVFVDKKHKCKYFRKLELEQDKAATQEKINNLPFINCPICNDLFQIKIGQLFWYEKGRPIYCNPNCKANGDYKAMIEKQGRELTNSGKKRIKGQRTIIHFNNSKYVRKPKKDKEKKPIKFIKVGAKVKADFLIKKMRNRLSLIKSIGQRFNERKMQEMGVIL